MRKTRLLATRDVKITENRYFHRQENGILGSFNFLLPSDVILFRVKIRLSKRRRYKLIDRVDFDSSVRILTKSEVREIRRVTLWDVITNATNVPTGAIQRRVFVWRDGDPCPQPFQLNSTVLEPCVPLQRYDYFEVNAQLRNIGTSIKDRSSPRITLASASRDCARINYPKGCARSEGKFNYSIFFGAGGNKS